MPKVRYRLPLIVPELKKYSSFFCHEVKNIFKTQKFVDSKYTKLLEDKLKKVLKRYILVTGSGTAALITVFDGINTKDRRNEIIVPSLTFPATIQAIIHSGLKPIFADIDPKTWTLDPVDAKRKITKKTLAIMPVNLFGIAANVFLLKRIARQYKVYLIYDSCQAFGTRIGNKSIGQFGDVEIFSLDATKIVAGGLGGFISTANKKLYRRFIFSKNFGNNEQRLTAIRGINSRMSEFNSVLAIASLSDFGKNKVRITKNVNLYKKLLVNNPKIILQDHTYCVPVQQFFAIYINTNRSEVKRIINELEQAGVEARSFYNLALHRLPFFVSKNIKLPNTEKMIGRLLMLPVNYLVSKKDINKIAEIINTKLI